MGKGWLRLAPAAVTARGGQSDIKETATELYLKVLSIWEELYPLSLISQTHGMLKGNEYFK